MELWIRSQDRERMTICRDLRIYNALEDKTLWVIEDCDDLGVYKSKERCMEIFDEIQKLLQGTIDNNHINKFDIYNGDNIKIYEMPKE